MNHRALISITTQIFKETEEGLVPARPAEQYKTLSVSGDTFEECEDHLNAFLKEKFNEKHSHDKEE